MRVRECKCMQLHAWDEQRLSNLKVVCGEATEGHGAVDGSNVEERAHHSLHDARKAFAVPGLEYRNVWRHLLRTQCLTV